MALLRGKHSFYLVNDITANGQTPLQDCEWSPSRCSKSKPLLIYNKHYVKLIYFEMPPFGVSGCPYGLIWNEKKL